MLLRVPESPMRVAVTIVARGVRYRGNRDFLRDTVHGHGDGANRLA